ncbi:MAG: peptide chain release factor N(5)-glutamine methyltransferase [Gammaproteobacteria bacterium]|nr:peptide chain release factor N(5)-glutamine methyltransferase [Gammaproteobacteria bacterium]
MTALTYRGLLDQATRSLYESSETPRIDAEYLLQHVIQKSMAWLITYGDSKASSCHVEVFLALIDERAKGVPVAYLMGYRDFWTLRLKVSKHVLIPRGDTEVLVEQALERIERQKPTSVLDLGTGSGAIALSIAKERSQATVLATDKHSDALEVAKINANLNDLKNVEFSVSDWFNNIKEQKFDLIASNPPYIEAKDPHLERGDLRFEPNTALIAQEQGLGDLNTIITRAPSYLKPNGWLIVEHGFNQATQVEEKIRASGFQNVSLYSDLNHLPRCTAAQWGNH